MIKGVDSVNGDIWGGVDKRDLVGRCIQLSTKRPPMHFSITHGVKLSRINHRDSEPVCFGKEGAIVQFGLKQDRIIKLTVVGNELEIPHRERIWRLGQHHRP